MDRREALKKLGAGSAVAIGTTFILDGHPVSALPSPACITPTPAVISAGAPSNVSGGTFTVPLNYPADATPSVVMGVATISNQVMTATPPSAFDGGSYKIGFTRPDGWCANDGGPDPPTWYMLLSYNRNGDVIGEANQSLTRT